MSCNLHRGDPWSRGTGLSECFEVDGCCRKEPICTMHIRKNVFPKFCFQPDQNYPAVSPEATAKAPAAARLF